MSPPLPGALALLGLAVAVVLSGCGRGSSGFSAISPANHPAFPIAAGEHALDCATCHTDPTTFSAFACIGCHTHDQTPTDLVHNSVNTYAYTSAACYQCHGAPTPGAYSHTGITGNCALCHAVGASFAALPRAGFTHIATSADCGSCHTTQSWGTGSAPQFISVGGFSIPEPPATSPTTQAGIANLPHPSNATLDCSICHQSGVGGAGAIGYDHASALINSSCNSCHEAGTNLVGTLWNGAATQSAGTGDSRPYTLTSITATRGGDSCNVTTPSHFFAVDCSECHSVPTGTGAASAGSAYTNAWTFPHATNSMSNPSTCNLCHGTPGCGSASD
ncbi:MAG TPA: hypothetical protein VFG53_16120 [Anaeromyxobacter sp.]|nr:hypothetical protein [Anaeromyxobacter sp.]